MCSKRYEGFHRLMRYVRSMRGNDEQQGAVFSYINPEERIPSDHPLRSIRAMVDGALQELWAHFEALYARRGRPSIPPEKLLRALLLQVLYSLRSERQLMESGGGRGDGAFFAGEDGLIAVAVGGRIGAFDIGRQRDVTDALEGGIKIGSALEADGGLPR